jgi:hypothetical protein
MGAASVFNINAWLRYAIGSALPQPFRA